MTSRWLSVALLAMGLMVGTARGQNPNPYIPTPFGAARIPEPTPIAPSMPPLAQGPIHPLDAPPGPPDSLNLPVGHSSAFQCENYPPETAIYFHAGALALQREDMRNKILSVLDTQNLDTGTFNTNGASVLNLTDVQEHPLYGGLLTVGYLCGNEAFEATGFYLAQKKFTAEASFPGQIDAFFFNPPLGFEGDNNLWLQADTMNVQQTTRLFSGELNYRWNNPAVVEAELILGVRYVDFLETLDVFTGDDDLTFRNIFGQPDPTRQATYTTQTHNRIVAPQVGFEYGKQWKFLAAGVTAKAACGANIVNTTHSLFRGDGFEGFSVERHDVNYLSQVYDCNAFLEFHLTERCRLRAAYNFVWLVNVNVAQDQIDYDLSKPQGTYNSHGNVFFQGPSLEIQFLF